MIDFLFTINDLYTEQIKLLIYSIEHNVKIDTICYHFIYNDLSDENINSINEYISAFRHKANFVKFDKQSIRFKTAGVWSEEIYYRLFAPYLLRNIDKVIYLDGDTLVTGEINDLIKTYTLERKAFAAVPNDVEKEHIKRLNLSKSCRYYNSGVLLINLKLLRDTYPEEYLLRDLDLLMDSLRFPDQDFINVVFQNQIETLPQKYNYMINVAEKSKQYKKMRHYSICHFVLSKPWGNEFKYKTDRKYLYYLAKSGKKKKALVLLYRHRKYRLWCFLKGRLK